MVRRLTLLSLGLATALSILGPQLVFAENELGVDQSLLIGTPASQPLTGEELDRTTESIASIMRCPVCQGLSVADSQTVSAIAMKMEIRDFLAAGYSREQILTYFEQSYGEFIRLEPKPEGFNMVVWIAPILALLIGCGLIATRMRAPRRSAEPDQAAAEEPALDEYLQQVRREVSP